jgi:hypothetical protein
MINPPFQYGLKGMSRENFGGHTKIDLIFWCESWEESAKAP